MIKTFHITPSNVNILDREIYKQPSFIKVYHPYCIHCENMKGEWSKLEKNLKSNFKGNISLFNVHSDSLPFIKNNSLKNINGFPTIKLFTSDGQTLYYNRDRSYNDMLKFCMENTNIRKKKINLNNKNLSNKLKKHTNKKKSKKKGHKLSKKK